MRPDATPEDVLDAQLVDRDDRRCGRVDGLEVGDDGSIEKILCGPAIWRRRMPRRLRWLIPDDDDLVEVPWSEVDKVGPYVHLKSRAQDLGLGRGDDELRWLSRLPWRDAQ